MFWSNNAFFVLDVKVTDTESEVKRKYQEKLNSNPKETAVLDNAYERIISSEKRMLEELQWFIQLNEEEIAIVVNNGKLYKGTLKNIHDGLIYTLSRIEDVKDLAILAKEINMINTLYNKIVPQVELDLLNTNRAKSGFPLIELSSLMTGWQIFGKNIGDYLASLTKRLGIENYAELLEHHIGDLGKGVIEDRLYNGYEELLYEAEGSSLKQLNGALEDLIRTPDFSFLEVIDEQFSKIMNKVSPLVKYSLVNQVYNCTLATSLFSKVYDEAVKLAANHEYIYARGLLECLMAVAKQYPRNVFMKHAILEETLEDTKIKIAGGTAPISSLTPPVKEPVANLSKYTSVKSEEEDVNARIDADVMLSSMQKVLLADDEASANNRHNAQVANETSSVNSNQTNQSANLKKDDFNTTASYSNLAEHVRIEQQKNTVPTPTVQKKTNNSRIIIIIVAIVLILCLLAGGGYALYKKTGFDFGGLLGQHQEEKTFDTSDKKSTTPYNNDYKIANTEASVGGLDVNATEAQMKQVLGTKFEESTEGNAHLYNYPIAKVKVVNGKVYSIYTKDKRVYTKRGAHVGMDISEVQKLYGDSYQRDPANDKKYIYDFDIGSNKKANMEFYTDDDGKVVTIGAVYDEARSTPDPDAAPVPTNANTNANNNNANNNTNNAAKTQAPKPAPKPQVNVGAAKSGAIGAVQAYCRGLKNQDGRLASVQASGFSFSSVSNNRVVVSFNIEKRISKGGGRFSVSNSSATAVVVNNGGGWHVASFY